MMTAWTGTNWDSNTVLQTDSLTVGSGGFVSASGTIAATHGILDNTLIENSHNLTIQGDLTDNGALDLNPGVVAISGKMLGHGELYFVGGPTTLELSANPTVTPYIVGFGSAQTIEVPGVNAVEYNPYQLTLLAGGNAVGTLEIMGTYAANGFQVAVHGGDGFITYTTPGHIG